ncbi:MAG TPA: glycosyltransferase family 1 protein [Candidatus Sumerlaeota bacterium]|nr:glycosyltransferase family 1 protein [Candidatus Sumerlaeota bacterium]
MSHHHHKPCIAIDARMIRHSGIGVFLSEVLRRWASDPPPFRLKLYGSVRLLEEFVPHGLDAEFDEWNPPVYSISAALSPPRFREKVDAWYSPHYATCLRVGVPLVCHVQDVLHHSHPSKTGHRVYSRMYLRALQATASFVLTTTRHVKVQLQTLYGFDAAKVLCTGAGPGVVEAHLNSNTPVPRELERREYLLAVGIYKPHKNWEFLLERLNGMRDVKLPIACAGLGDNGPKLRELAQHMNLKNEMILLPPLNPEQLTSVYKQATALLFPSIAEGFGLPILEAMATGTPVLIADRSPMKEIAEGSAFTFKPDYAETFDNALRILLNDREARDRYVAAGLKRAKLCSWDRTARHVQDALMRTVTGKLPLMRIFPQSTRPIA